eukprot:gene8283-9167_t
MAPKLLPMDSPRLDQDLLFESTANGDLMQVVSEHDSKLLTEILITSCLKIYNFHLLEKEEQNQLKMFRSFFGNSPTSGCGHEFVGQQVELGEQKLKIKKVLGEGGYGFVFSAQDLSSGKSYALKRLMASDDAAKNGIMHEISVLKKLRGHPNIIKFIAAASSGNEKLQHGMVEFLILTELCSGGELIDLLQENGMQALPFQDIMCIFAQTSKAVSHMHKQVPPIIHRDLKIENLLISGKGMIKLCDFGSSTTKALFPDQSWTALQRSLAEDEIQKNTTPMYRAPEMIDLYSNYPITTKADVWALGCILYTLCYLEHPFKDSAKLKILNANYSVPQNVKDVSILQPLIDKMFQVNPSDRSSTDDVLYEVEKIAETNSFDLKKPVLNINQAERSQQVSSAIISTGNVLGGSAILGNVVKGAGTLFSNIKDASSKVVQSVAGYVSNELDLSYITSRIIVMSYPADGIESKFKNSIDDVRIYLDTKFTDRYVVINISQRLYKVDKLNDRVFESGWNAKKSPTLNQLVSLCRKINNFLRQDKKNIVAIHCLDGKLGSSIMIAAFLLFIKLFTQPSMALDMFSLRRLSPGEKCNVNPSQLRYLGYVSQLVWEPRIIPHKRPMFLKTITINSVPLFNKARTGCRPFIEIFQSDQRMLSTAQDLDLMREYLFGERKIELNVNAAVIGDVTISLFHGRSTFGGKVQGKLTSINIFTLQFHTGFVDHNLTMINFPRRNLDIMDPDEQKYGANFSVSLDFAFGSETSSNISSYTEPWEKMNVEKLSPSVCFASKEEYRDCREEFGLSEVDMEASEGDDSLSQFKSELATEGIERRVGYSTFFHPDKVKEESEEEEISKEVEVEKKDDEFFEQLIDIGVQQQLSGNDKERPNENGNKRSDPEKVVDDFSSLRINSRNVDQDKPETKSHVSTKETSDIGILLDFGHEETGDLHSHSQQSPIRKNVSAQEFHAFADESSSHDTTTKTKRSLSLKKNKSTSDLFEGHNEDEFFQQLGERNSPRHQTTEFNDHNQSEHLFSIRSHDFVDPFSPSYHDRASKLEVPTSQLSSSHMKHSSSDGDLLAEWAHVNTPSTTLNPKPHEFQSNQPIQQSSHQANFASVASNDPFADLANFSAQSGFGKETSSTSAKTTTSQFTSTHTTRNQSNLAGRQQNQSQSSNYAPNYFINTSRPGNGVFTSQSKGGLGGNWGQRPASKDEFSDILGAHGFKASSETQRETLSQLKKPDNRNEIDPIKRKIRDWADGKERNIRALLCSIDTVLWEEEDKWRGCAMHELIQPNQVKKFYRKACLCVHPDKHTGTSHENLARAIFIELNEAWTLFENSGSKPLY